MENRCVFSPDRKYRYQLHHVWDDAKPTVAFIGLNPSTADESKLDPTLRRIRGFSEDWGFGSFVMLNLFAFRATDPKVMKNQDDPVGPENNRHITESCIRCTKVIACWGNHGSFRKRSDGVIRLLKEGSIALHYLKMTKAGHPSHPLYLKRDLTPQEFMEKETCKLI